MITIDKVAENLFDKIRARFNKVVIRDEKRKKTLDPTKARFFSFKFSAPDEDNIVVDYGSITISLVDSQSLKIFYDMEIEKDMSDAVRQHWYKFLQSMRKFAKRNMVDSFDVRDISKAGLELKDLKHLNKDADVFDSDEALSESRMVGTSRSSYQVLENAKIIVRHSKRIEENEDPRSRSRNIAAIFIENQAGERFKLPLGTTINEARIIARHVRNEGTIHDDFGSHLMGMLNEMHQLKKFSRNMRGRTFEDQDTQAMLESAQDHYGELHSNFFSLRTQRGYEQFREGWEPDEGIIMDEIDLDEMRKRFEKRYFDERLEEALPVIARAHKYRKTKMEEEFGAWMESVIEKSFDKIIKEDIDPTAPQNSSSPLSTAGENRIGIDSISQTKTIIDSEKGGRSINKFFQDHDFNVHFQDGKWHFTSEEELNRALDWAAKDGVNLDKDDLKVAEYDPQPFGSSMNDQSFRNDVAMESMLRLAGLKK